MAARAAPALGDFFTKKVGKKKKQKGAPQDDAGPVIEEEVTTEAAKAVAEEAAEDAKDVEVEDAAAAKGEAEEAAEQGEEEAGEEEAGGAAEDEAYEEEEEPEEEAEEPAEEEEGEEDEEAVEGTGTKALRPPMLREEADDGQAVPGGPRMDFAASSRDAVEIHSLTPGCAEVIRVATLPPVQGVEGIGWSPDGRWLGLLGPRSLQVLDASDGEYDVYCELWPLDGEARAGLKAFHFSPLGTYGICYEPFTRADAQAEPEPNLAVWRLGPEPELVGSFAHERRAECGWPALRWTQDERWCCRLARDEVQVFPGDRPELEAQEATIACEGVIALEPSPRPADGKQRSPEYVALFVPQRKGERARCFVYSLSDTSSPTAVQDLPQADNVSMRWNPAGTSLLLLTSTDVDGSGKSYFGKTGLHLLHAKGGKGHAVVGAKAGPVHDVAWSPQQDEFLLLHGDLPCAMTLHDGQQAKKVLDFGKAHRNTIQWSPAGRFFALGGFGQLAGDLDFWDRPSGEKLGQTRYECCVDCQWSADGRHLLGWTTAPRMRVENRLELFDYAGSRLFRVDYDELFAASWRPMPAEAYPDRPPTPSRSRMGSMQAERRETPKTAAYRAPMSSGTLAARLRAEGEGGERTRAKTAGEQAAEAAEGKAKRQEPTKKEIREVPVPSDLVGGIIGTKGSAIKELSALVKLPLEVKPPSSSNDGEGACVRIGPAGPWDDLDRAEELVRKRIDELRQAQRRGFRSGREVPVPEDLVARLIGLQGASIQELMRQTGVTLKVRQASDGSGGQVVLIGPPPRGEDEEKALRKAEELVLAKLAEFRESDEQRREDRRQEQPAEIMVPTEIVGGLIGHKGATIEELSREAGVRIRIPRNKGEEISAESKVQIGPADPEAVARATELILAKVDALQQSAGKGRNDKGGDSWAAQKGWRNNKGWDGEAGWDGDHGWGDEKGWNGEKGWAEKGWKAEKGWAEDWDVDKGWAGDKGWHDEGNWAEDGSWTEDRAWAEERSRGGERGWKGERNRGGERGEDGREGGRVVRGQKWRGEQGAAWTNGKAEEPSYSSGATRTNGKGGEQTSYSGAAWTNGKGEEQPSYSSGSSRPSERRNGRGQALPQDAPSAVGAEGGEAASMGAGEPQVEKREKSKTSEELERLRTQGDAALLSGDFRAAVELFTKAVRLQPRDCRALCGRSKAQLELGDFHEAFNSASIAVRVQPESAVAQLRKGLALRSLGQEDKAQPPLQEALRLDPDSREVREALGKSSSHRDQRAEGNHRLQATDEERAFRCAECEEAAEFGAIDEADGNWYCKACWESFVSEDPMVQRPVGLPEDEGPLPQAAAAVAEPAEPTAPAEESVLPSAGGAGVPPARRRWADEPVQDDGFEDLAQPRERRRGLDRAPAAAPAGPAPRGARERPLGSDRHQGADRARAEGGKDGHDRRQGAGKGAGKGSGKGSGKGAAKAGAGAKDRGERRKGDERFGGKGGDEHFGGRGGDERPGGRGGDDRFGGRGGDERPGGRKGDDRPGGRGGGERSGGRGGDERSGGRGGDDRPGGRGGDERPGGRDAKGGGGFLGGSSSARPAETPGNTTMSMPRNPFGAAKPT